MADAIEQRSLVRLVILLKLTSSEPEFRLFHMFLAVIGCGVGMFVYGYMLETQASVYVCSFFWGFMMFGVLVGGISTMGYALDAFRESSNELFIMNMFFKVHLSDFSWAVLT